MRTETHTTKRSLRIATAVLTLVFTGGAVALAAGPLRGKTYTGGVPSTGVESHGHHVRTHASGDITLHVSSNGRSVSVHFTGAPVFYCVTQQQIHVQTTKAASITRSGSFKASVGERFAAGPGPPAIVQVISGQFSGGSVRGSIRTQAAECSGVASFSASAH